MKRRLAKWWVVSLRDAAGNTWEMEVRAVRAAQARIVAKRELKHLNAKVTNVMELKP